MFPRPRAPRRRGPGVPRGDRVAPGSLGWTDAEAADAFVALERHCHEPKTAEEWVIHDANYVELLGAFGVAKAFTKGGAERQSYEETLAIFESNLDRIGFCTPRGRALAGEGRAYARAFVARLQDELAGGGVA